MRDPIVVKALDVQPGDVLPGGMIVGDITHGPLDRQIRVERAPKLARMKTGRNLQAEALVEIMVKKGLIEDVGGNTYRITPKGKAYSRHLEGAL